MKSLLINKNAKISFEKNQLKINGKLYLPNEVDFTDLFIDCQDGFISLKAMYLLTAHNVNLHILHYSGSVLGTYIPLENVDGKLKLAQLTAYQTKREEYAKAILDAKLEAQHTLLKAISAHYNIQTEFTPVGNKLLTIEAKYAQFYFSQLSTVFNALYPEFKFIGRTNTSHNNKAQDPINAMLNFAYSIIQALTLKHINYYGLLPEISFIHELSTTKHSLAFDLMEFLRPLADLAVIQTLQTKKLTWNDFVYSQLTTCRLMPNAQHLLLAHLQILLNTKVEGKQLETWHKENIKAFAESLTQSKIPSFKVLLPTLYDNEEIITRLKNMTPAERKQLSIKKNTLWYIQKNLEEGKSIKVYNKVLSKL